MLAIYTETLEELLANKGYGTESQDQSLTDVIAVMNKFPDFVFGQNIRLSMLNLFLEKYDIREIGSETEELFLHFWKERANELVIKYVPKMTMWLNNFNDLFKFTVQLTINDSANNSKSGTRQNANHFVDDNQSQNTYYLNPANASTPNLKVDDVDKNETDNIRDETRSENHNDSETRQRIITRDVLQTVWGKTRADILNKIFQLQDVFNECIKEFETIFMGVL